MMCSIIETYLPPDFYIEMIGLKTHSLVLEQLILFQMPNLYKKVKELDFQMINLTPKFFLTLFMNLLPESIGLRVLDIFLLHGMDNNKVLFDITFGYLKVMESKALACKDS